MIYSTRSWYLLGKAALVLVLIGPGHLSEGQNPAPQGMCDCLKDGLCNNPVNQLIPCPPGMICSCRVAAACKVECDPPRPGFPPACNCVRQPPKVGPNPKVGNQKCGPNLCPFSYVLCWAEDPAWGNGCICPLVHWTTLTIIYKGGSGCPAQGTVQICDGVSCPSTCGGGC